MTAKKHYIVLTLPVSVRNNPTELAAELDRIYDTYRMELITLKENGANPFFIFKDVTN